jgi:O-methyltransferase
MASLQFQDVSNAQLIAMSDGLMNSGDCPTAVQLLRFALRQASDPKEQQRIRTRLGMMTNPNKRTPHLLRMLKELEAQNYENPFVADGMATWLKTLPFAEDAKFQQLADKHSGLLPIANWHWNLSVALWAVQACKPLKGDYIELGVFKGHTTLFCAEYVGFADWDRRWWLYDTFEGIPKDQQAPGWEAINKRTYEGKYSFEEVRDRFASIPNIVVKKGRVPEVLLEECPDTIAFLHIDLNNAPAEIGALELLFDRMAPGGVILFDDYCWATTKAQHDAEKIWFAKRDLHVLPLPTGQGIFVNPR